VGAQYVGPDLIEEIALFGLTFLWILFGAIFFVGRRGAAPKSETTSRSNRSRFGIVIQLLSYAILYSIERPYFTPIVPMPKIVEAVLLLVATAIGIASIAFCYSAARELGKQWSLVARVVQGHELIQTGPFAVVRHPIYLAMFGLLLQAGIVVSIWQAVIPAIVAFMVGTYVRIEEEEKILREKFGAQYEEYARHVPAFIPKLI
jgi:protein-S-isoprenylcysteine O-methyltransferase Ste14